MNSSGDQSSPGRLGQHRREGCAFANPITKRAAKIRQAGDTLCLHPGEEVRAVPLAIEHDDGEAVQERIRLKLLGVGWFGTSRSRRGTARLIRRTETTIGQTMPVR
jgi:hypothetical protein